MITLVIGGARSGKSSYAESLAARYAARPEDVTYIATAEVVPGDAEMAARIAAHRASRPAEWRTWEGEAADIPGVVAASGGVMLMDCLTMYLGRVFFAEPAHASDSEAEWRSAEERIRGGVRRIFEACPAASRLIVVTNELGWGIVPEDRMSRRFRDMQGRANREVASLADEVALVVAGIPVVIKGEGA